MFHFKPEQSLDNILGVFNKVKIDLTNFISNAKAQKQDLENKLIVVDSELTKSQEVLEQVKKFTTGN